MKRRKRGDLCTDGTVRKREKSIFVSFLPVLVFVVAFCLHENILNESKIVLPHSDPHQKQSRGESKEREEKKWTAVES